MDAIQNLIHTVEAHRDQIISLCSELVKIPSENPPGDTRKIVKFIAEYLGKEGLDCQIYSPKENMPNIVASFKGAQPGRRLIYNGHIDTYPAGDARRWQYDPFSGKVADGKIYGRGASDMKGGVAASIMAFILLTKMRHLLNGEIVMTLVADEETGGKWGAKWLLDNVPIVTGDAMINGEPTSCEMVQFGEKGRVFIDLEAKGRGANGAYPHIGDNAIWKMMLCLQDLRELEKLDLVPPPELWRVLEGARDVVERVKGKGAADVMMRVTVNVGIIHGGLNVNTVPELCRASVDIRLPPGVECDRVLKEIDKRVALREGVSYEITQAMEYNYTPPDNEICAIMKKSAEIAKGTKVVMAGAIGGSDSKHFRKRNIPCVLYGPRWYSMGGTDEFITIDDLIITTKAHALASLFFLNAE